MQKKKLPASHVLKGSVERARRRASREADRTSAALPSDSSVSPTALGVQQDPCQRELATSMLDVCF